MEAPIQQIQYADSPFIQTPTRPIQPEKASIVEMQLDVDSIITSLKMHLRGLKFNRAKQCLEIDQEATPLISEEGANRLLSDLKTVLEHPVVLGTLMEEEARNFATEYALTCAEQITINADKWDVKKISDLDSFVDNTSILTYCNFTRAVKGTTFKGIINMSMLRELKSLTSHERETQAQKAGLGDRLKRAFR